MGYYVCNRGIRGAFYVIQSYVSGIEDAEKANQIFDILMGSEVEPRKRFIQTHAKAVKNLDI